MFNARSIQTAHCIGIGGIHVSAVARLLHARGVVVTGSDAVASEETTRLTAEGITVTIGQNATNIPSQVDVVIYSDAVPEDQPERQEATRRDIPAFDSHQFLGELFRGAAQIIVTGTHGKSTTTAMIGLMLEAAGADPTVVMGTRVLNFPLHNLRIGREEVLVAEGDEYRSHVLNYEPTILVLNNIEWDHPDVFPTLEAYVAMFGAAIEQVRKGGTVVYNEGDEQVRRLVEQQRVKLEQRGVRLVRADDPSHIPDLHLRIPGQINLQNAAMALATVRVFSPAAHEAQLVETLDAFPGVWRRFEHVGDFNGAPVISDYAHHPTAIRETLAAAREAFPGRRIVLCYQPHQRARTKSLFPDFIAPLASADVLVLAEIYDVTGREEPEYADVSSKQLLEAINQSDAARVASRSYAPDIADAEQQLRTLIQPNDLVLIMGAGTIDSIARHLATLSS